MSASPAPASHSPGDAPITYLTEEAKRPLRLSYLDGLRGFAALYVVLHHSLLYARYGYSVREMPAWLNFLWLFFKNGHYSVVVFIVLSGYCLMLPVARNEARWFPGGIGRYLRRRALRILPPYYISLLFALALAYGLGFNRPLPENMHWRDWLPVTFNGALSHLLVVHNVNEQWSNQINGPAWTVATEWQLYFLLPLLILLWRRFGLIAMTLVSLVVGLSIRFIAPSLTQACYWFLASFAFGAAAAVRGFDPSFRVAALERPIFRAIRWGLCLAVAIALLGRLPVIRNRITLMDTLVGAAAAVCLLEWSRQAGNAASGKKMSVSSAVVLRVLENPCSLWLGRISYSLYLVHGPILNSLQGIACQTGTNIPLTVGLVMGVGVPVALGVAVLFHRFVEAPSLRLR